MVGRGIDGGEICHTVALGAAAQGQQWQVGFTLLHQMHVLNLRIGGLALAMGILTSRSRKPLLVHGLLTRLPRGPAALDSTAYHVISSGHYRTPQYLK